MLLAPCAAALSAVMLSACAPQRFDSGFLTMGTTASIAVLATDAQQAQQASRAVEQLWSTQARDWHAFAEPAGELRRLNTALANAEPFDTSASLLELLRISQQATAASQGFFDPAITPMTQLWGFADADAPASQPSPEQQHAWQQQHPSMTELRIDRHTVSSTHTALQLDLGGIAKGQALDTAAQLLRAHHIQDALLDLGGQLLRIGADPTLTLPIAIRAPRADSPLAFITLKDGESLATSGDYERYHTAHGKQPLRMPHIFNPHTGLPVTHTQAVTVIAHGNVLSGASAGAWADAASTALMAASPDHWQTVARNMGIREALRIDASGEVQVTAAMYARLRWGTARPSHLSIIALSPP